MTRTTIKMIIKSNNNSISYDNYDRDINVIIIIRIAIITIIIAIVIIIITIIMIIIELILITKSC